MAGFIAVLDFDGNGRIKKYADFATLAAAQSHVAAFIGQYPQAFAAPKPGASFFDWKINPSGKTINVDPRARPQPVETREMRALRRIAADLAEPAKSEVLAILNEA